MDRHTTPGAAKLIRPALKRLDKSIAKLSKVHNKAGGKLEQLICLRRHLDDLVDYRAAQTANPQLYDKKTIRSTQKTVDDLLNKIETIADVAVASASEMDQLLPTLYSATNDVDQAIMAYEYLKRHGEGPFAPKQSRGSKAEGTTDTKAVATVRTV